MPAKFDRSKFKAASLAANEKLKQELEAKRPKAKSNNAEYVNLQMGANVLRIYPPHPDGKSYKYPKCVSWLPYYKEDKEKGTKELSRRPVFNAKIHSAHPEEDIIESYIDFAKQLISGRQKSGEITADEAKKEIDKLYGFKTGIYPKTSWVMYADVDNSEGKNFGRLEVGVSVANKLDEAAMGSEDPDDPMAVDPYTDPDTGFKVKVTKNDHNEVSPNDVYKVALLFQKPAPLSDKDLESFAELDPLSKHFENSYYSTDFEKAIEGLEIYDEQNNIGVFSEMPEFLDVCERLAALYPDREDTPTGKEELKEASAPKKQAAKPKPEPEEEEEANDEPTDELPWDKAEQKEEAPKSGGNSKADELKAKLAALKKK